MHISFIGDISLNDDYSDAVKRGENPFAAISEVLKSKDFVVGNLEAVVKNENQVHPFKQTVLSIDKACLPLLKSIPVHLLTLANNHIYDQLSEGFEDTTNYLDKEKIHYCGAYSKSKQSKKVYIQKLSDHNIVYLNYVHSATNPMFPDDCKVVVNQYNRDEILEEIKKYKVDNYLIILILHWGQDNSRFPAPWQRKDAKDFIMAGADLIIGHHSHVLQGYEIIEGKHVFYSLGNFAFAPMQTKEKIYEIDNSRQRESIIINLLIDRNLLNITYKSISLKELNVIPYKSNKLKKISKFIPLVSNKIVWPLYLFYLKRVYKIYFYFFGNNRNPFKQLAKINTKLLRKIFK